MPAEAAQMAVHVRGAIGVRRMTRARIAVTSGATLMTTSVLATVVKVSASMKQQNIAHHMKPDSIPARPARRTAPTKSR